MRNRNNEKACPNTTETETETVGQLATSIHTDLKTEENDNKENDKISPITKRKTTLTGGEAGEGIDEYSTI